MYGIAIFKNFMNAQAIFELENIEQSFKTKNNDLLYLRNINLSIKEQEIYGIIGRFDSGKNALFNTILLKTKPIAGKINFNKTEITNYTDEQLRNIVQDIALIPQNPQLLNSQDVFNNVALPLKIKNINKKEITKRVNDILATVKLTKETYFKLGQLNHSQKQKVSIARALVQKPKLLLCDEITSGLEPKVNLEIINILKEVNQRLNIAIIINTKDSQIIKNLCQKIIVMQQGKILEIIKPEELFLHPNSSVAKDFIRSTTKTEIPLTYRRQLTPNPSPNSNPLIRLTFQGNIAPEFVISKAIGKHNLQVNIIQGYQETINNININVILTEFKGDKNNIEDALDFLTTSQFNAEILGYVNNTN